MACADLRAIPVLATKNDEGKRPRADGGNRRSNDQGRVTRRRGKMLDWRRSRSYLAATAAAALLGACGGSNGPGKCPDGTTGVPPNCMSIQVSPPPCTQTTVESGAGPVKPSTLYHFDFSVPDSGRLDITLDWTTPANAFGIYLVPVNTCTLAEFNARSCDFLVRSESTMKPRKISVANFNAGNYRWLIANFSNNDESISYQFVLSKGSCPALAGAAPSVSARDAEAFPALTRAESH
jgi:hypothetical protein